MELEWQISMPLNLQITHLSNQYLVQAPWSTSLASGVASNMCHIPMVTPLHPQGTLWLSDPWRDLRSFRDILSSKVLAGHKQGGTVYLNPSLALVYLVGGWAWI